MLKKEAELISTFIKPLSNQTILNVCSSDEAFYKRQQPHIWKFLHQPLLNANNRLINLDIKNDKGVDIVNDCRDMKDIQTNSIDTVLFFSGFEHLLNPRLALEEIYRVLKNDGTLIASCPGVYPYHEDPIDNEMRMPLLENWQNFLQGNWDILEFKPSEPEAAHPNYHFPEPVFATVVKAQKKPGLTEVKADAFVLSYRREKNLPLVITGLQRQSFIDKIYIFHNHPSQKKIPGAINILSEKNFGCLVRHAMALMSNQEYILFIDDDLELKTDFSQRFWEALAIEPQAIIGMFGVDIETQLTDPHIYANSYHCQFSPFRRYVDIVKGRIHLVKKSLLVHPFAFQAQHHFPVKASEDDILLNLSTQLKTKIPSIIIPVKTTEITNLREDEALWKRKQHLSIRSAYILEFIRQGWQPLANKDNYYNHNLKQGGSLFLDDRHIHAINRCVKEKNPNQALEHYKKISHHFNIPALLLYNLAGQLRDQQLTDEAEKIYFQVTTMDQVDIKKLKGLSFFHLGIISLKRKSIAEAKNYLIQCLQWTPDHQLAAQKLNEISNNN